MYISGSHLPFLRGSPPTSPRSVKCCFFLKGIEIVHYSDIVFLNQFSEERLRDCVTLVPGWARGGAHKIITYYKIL